MFALDVLSSCRRVALVKKAVRVPVLANGNVRCHADVAKNLQDTGADGIMSAEGMLDDPTLMAPRLRKTEKKTSRTRETGGSAEAVEQ